MKKDGLIIEIFGEISKEAEKIKRIVGKIHDRQEDVNGTDQDHDEG